MRIKDVHANRLKVRVGHDSLVGEVIRIDNDKATIQVYEETGMSSFKEFCQTTG